MPWLFAFFTLFSLSAPAAANDCLQPYAAVAQKLAVVWLPYTGFVYTTSNIAIDETVWNTSRRYFIRDQFPAFKNLLAQRRLGYFSFEIRASQAQIDELKGFLEQRLRHDETCAGGTCLALSQMNILNIPFPFSRSPILQALYLSVLRMVPGSRVVSISFHGSRPFHSIFHSPDFYREVRYPLVDGALIAGAGVGGTLIARVVIRNAQGEEEEIIVPIVAEP